MASFGGIIQNPVNSVSRAIVLVLVVFGFFVFSSPLSLHAQEPEDLSQAAPPPAKTLSKEEKDLLESTGDTKKLTKVALEFMEARIKKAEEADSKDDFPAMFIELGGFHAVMDYALDFLLKKHTEGKRAFTDFKRYEQGLRGFTPRLELIRRDLPIRYEYYVRLLVKELRDNRARAIDPMFGNTVVPDKKN